MGSSSRPSIAAATEQRQAGRRSATKTSPGGGEQGGRQAGRVVQVGLARAVAGQAGRQAGPERQEHERR